jgi:ferric-dicitrate binding protein FerR (iron transport regulator)
MNKDQERRWIAERAAEWLIRLETASPQEREEFWHWIRQSPLHIKEYLAAQATDTVLMHLLRGRALEVSEFADDGSNVVQID